jgi:hypothetical protein
VSRPRIGFMIAAGRIDAASATVVIAALAESFRAG